MDIISANCIQTQSADLPSITKFIIIYSTDCIQTQSADLPLLTPYAITPINCAQTQLANSPGGWGNYQFIGTMYDIGPFIYRDVEVGKTYWFKAVSLSPFDVESANPPLASITMVGTAAVGITYLSATAAFRNIFLNWTSINDPNVFITELWRSDTNDRAVATLIGSGYGTSYTDLINAYGVTKYYWVRNKNPNGGYSAWYPVDQHAGVSATTAFVQGSEIDNFAVDLSDIYMKIPVVTGDAWTDNSPSAGYVAWNAHTLYYNGVAYSISAGNTNNKYIYWLNAGTSYSGSDSNPTLTDGDFVIAVNISGVHDLAWNAIANEVIGSAYIENGAILNAKIGNLEVDSAKIADLTVGTIKISGFAVTRGTQYYSATGIYFDDDTEVEIGTITLYTNETTDSVWVWASIVMLIHPNSGSGKEGVYNSINLRIRRNNTTGPAIAAVHMNPYMTPGPHSLVPALPPVVLIGTDIPGGSVGAHIYKLTVNTEDIDGGDHNDGEVGYIQFTGFAKSR